MSTITTPTPTRIILANPVGEAVQLFTEVTDGEGAHHEVRTIQCVNHQQAVAVARLYEALGCVL